MTQSQENLTSAILSSISDEGAFKRTFSSNFISELGASRRTLRYFVFADRLGDVNQVARYALGADIAVNFAGSAYAVQQGIANGSGLQIGLGIFGFGINSRAARNFDSIADGIVSGLRRKVGSNRIQPITDSGRLLSPQAHTVNAAGTIVSSVTKKDKIFFRVFSGDNMVGGFLTAVRPRSAAFAREALALPRSNTAEFIQEVLVPAGTRLQRSRAAAIEVANNVFPLRRGGAEQFELLNRIPIENFRQGVPFQ